MTNDETKEIIDGYQKVFEESSSTPEDLETPVAEIRAMATATQAVVVALIGLSHEARVRVLEAAKTIALDREPPLVEKLMPVILPLAASAIANLLKPSSGEIPLYPPASNTPSYSGVQEPLHCILVNGVCMRCGVAQTTASTHPPLCTWVGGAVNGTGGLTDSQEH